MTLPTKKTALAGNALGAEVALCRALRREQVVGQLIRQDAVDLLRHCPIAAAQPGLDVRYRDAPFRRDERARQRRVHVSDNEHEIGVMLGELGVERRHDPCRLHGMRP